METTKLFQQPADGRTGLVFDLIQHGMDAKSIDANGVSLIQWCAYCGDVTAIKFLIAKGESLSELSNLFAPIRQQNMKGSSFAWC